jgi:hypothetical protein
MSVSRLLKLTFVVALMLAAVVETYRRWLGAWQRRWGTQSDEAERTLPGDEIVQQPNYLTTRAITVDAPPEDIYPWLLQMGYHRGGLYSYDILDRLFGFTDAPSATTILPEFQDLKVGDAIPLGRGEPFPVRELIPNRAFILGGEQPDTGLAWSWQTVLEPIDDSHTRLITRNRGRFSETPLVRALMLAVDVAAFVMVRRWLMVLKARAEARYAGREQSPAAAQPTAPTPP